MVFLIIIVQVGVEHLLRDINDPSTSILAMKIKQKVTGLSGLAGKLIETQKYLTHVVEGRIPLNHQILYNLQNILSFRESLKDLSKTFVVLDARNCCFEIFCENFLHATDDF